MKIVYVTMQFPVPSEAFASLDIETLRSKGHELTVYTLRPKHKKFKEMMRERKHDGIVVKSFSFKSIFVFIFFLFSHPKISLSLSFWVFNTCKSNVKHLFKSLILFPSVISLFYEIKKMKPDVVHLFWGHYPSMLGFLIKKEFPSVVVTQFLGAHDLLSGYPGSIKFSTQANAVFTHSYSNLKKIDSLGIDAKSVNVIHRGTILSGGEVDNISKFDSVASPILFVAARLIEEKGIDDVIWIFSSICHEFPSAKLYIAGDGPCKETLLTLTERLEVNDKVFFLGHISHEDVIVNMKKAHFFILMSRYPSERLPNVVKEAMAQQCVVVTTRTDGIDELVTDGETGFIVKKRDCERALSLLGKCLNDPALCKLIAHQSRLKVVQDFDVNVSMDKYLDIWVKEAERVN